MYMICVESIAQNFFAQVNFDSNVSMLYGNNEFVQEHQKGYGIGTAIGISWDTQSFGIRYDREFANYEVVREAPLFQIGYKENVEFQVNRIGLFGGSMMQRMHKYQIDIMYGLGFSWVQEQSVTGVRQYASGSIHELDLDPSAMQVAYSIMVGLNYTRMFGHRLGVRAEVMPVVRLTNEWVEGSNGYKFQYPIGPDPSVLLKVGMGLIVKFGGVSVSTP